jgi:hypothetical protein
MNSITPATTGTVTPQASIGAGNEATLRTMQLGFADLTELSRDKSRMWAEKVHETSTRGIKQPDTYYRGMRLTLSELKQMAAAGMSTPLAGRFRGKLNATNQPFDAFVFALTGGYRPGSVVVGPKDDYYSVIFAIDGVGRDINFAWNTHGPSYSSDRIFISDAIPADALTKLWVFDKSTNSFVDFSALWNQWKNG